MQVEIIDREAMFILLPLKYYFNDWVTLKWRYCVQSCIFHVIADQSYTSMNGKKKPSANKTLQIIESFVTLLSSACPIMQEAVENTFFFQPWKRYKAGIRQQVFLFANDYKKIMCKKWRGHPGAVFIRRGISSHLQKTCFLFLPWYSVHLEQWN